MGAVRFKVGPDDLAKWMPRLVPRKGNAAEVQASEEQPASCHTVELPEADMARLRQMQQTHARLFAAQQQKVRLLCDPSCLPFIAPFRLYACALPMQ